MVSETFHINGKEIAILFGDITQVAADAIVSSDDNHLTMSGGVSMAIHHAGGEIIWTESRRYVPAQIGTAVVTPAGSLPAKYVIHAIVIDFDEMTWPDFGIVQSATKCCLVEADRLDCETIAIPALGTGLGGLTSQVAARAMIEAILAEVGRSKNLKRVTLVLGRPDTLFDFLKTTVEEKTRAEYAGKLETLKQEKEQLIAELREKSPYRNLPFPLAVARRLVDSHDAFHSKFTAAVECAESIVKYCASIAMADYLRLEPDTGNVLHHLFGTHATFGFWHRQLEETLKHLKEKPSFPIIPEMYDFYFSANKGLITDIIKIRNEMYGHGATLPESLYQTSYAELVLKLDKLLEALKFACEYPLVVATQTEVLEDSYEYEVLKIMGDNVIFRKDVLRRKNLRLPRNSLHLLDRDGERALALSPFLVFETCPHCCVQETFFLEATDEKSLKYHTYRANHRMETGAHLERFHLAQNAD